MEKNNKGFTLVEILAVIIILGIIMIVALPTYSSVYNAIRLTTHLNNIKTIRSAALDYGSNSYIKDTVKNLHDNTSKETSSKDWCKTISISNLIQAGYLTSDTDELDQITDVFTGTAMGYNLQNRYTGAPLDGVALCYCSEKLDIEAYVIKDLAVGQIYHKGEYIRNYVNDELYEFKELKVSFIYNDVFKKIVNARTKSSVDIEGINIELKDTFDGITSDFTINNTTLVNKINKLIFNSKLVNESTCKHA